MRSPTAARLWFVSLASLASFAWVTTLEHSADAYCRTGTCPLPSGFIPTAAACEPANFTSCVVGTETFNDLPLFWKNICIGYSVQKDASKFATLNEVTTAASGAFAAWAAADCPGAPSIQGQDLGPVVCGDAAFNLYAGNQNVIVFRDGQWPHKTAAEQASGQASPTVALTTVSYDRDTGEILDADIELNTADHKIIVTSSLTTGVFDLQSVLTHEAGHFFGLGHSPDRTSVMYYQDEGGSARHRALAADDARGVCTIYPPSGPRPVSTMVAASGTVAAGSCDPAPRNGLSSTCQVDKAPPSSSSGCGLSPARDASQLGWFALAGVGLVAWARRRRARS